MVPQAPSSRRQYDSDLSDEQWMLMRGLLPKPKSNGETGGRPPRDRREILNAILYVARTGCQWRMLPHDFPHWRTVYGCFAAWDDAGVFENLNARLRRKIRLRVGRSPEPSAGIIDSQSVKIAANLGHSGFDGAKKVNGRKRHIVVDTLGLLLTVVVHEASVSDREGAKDVLAEVRARFKRVRKIFADQGYTGKLVEFVRMKFSLVVEIVKRVEIRTFHVLPRRWVVERTFGWCGFYRRLAKDYERSTRRSEAFVYIAMSNIMLCRLAPA